MLKTYPILRTHLFIKLLLSSKHTFNSGPISFPISFVVIVRFVSDYLGNMLMGRVFFSLK